MSGVRKAITPVIAFFVLCIWLGLLPIPRLHNLLVLVLGICYLPVYLIRNPAEWLPIVAPLGITVVVFVLGMSAYHFVSKIKRSH